MDLPQRKLNKAMTMNDLALIDEISGLNTFLEGFIAMNNIPETVKDRIRARMITYDSTVPKEVALNEMRDAIFGTGR